VQQDEWFLEPSRLRRPACASARPPWPAGRVAAGPCLARRAHRAPEQPAQATGRSMTAGRYEAPSGCLHRHGALPLRLQRRLAIWTRACGLLRAPGRHVMAASGAPLRMRAPQRGPGRVRTSSDQGTWQRTTACSVFCSRAGCPLPSDISTCAPASRASCARGCSDARAFQQRPGQGRRPGRSARRRPGMRMSLGSAGADTSLAHGWLRATGAAQAGGRRAE